MELFGLSFRSFWERLVVDRGCVWWNTAHQATESFTKVACYNSSRQSSPLMSSLTRKPLPALFRQLREYLTSFTCIYCTCKAFSRLFCRPKLKRHDHKLGFCLSCQPVMYDLNFSSCSSVFSGIVGIVREWGTFLVCQAQFQHSRPFCSTDRLYIVGE